MASMQLEKPHEEASLKAADAGTQCCEVNKASAAKEMAVGQTHPQESKHDELKQAHESALTQHAKVGAADEKKKKKKEKEKDKDKKKSASAKPAAKVSHKVKEEKKVKEKKEKKKSKHKDDNSSSDSDSDGHENKKKPEGKKFK